MINEVGVVLGFPSFDSWQIQNNNRPLTFSHPEISGLATSPHTQGEIPMLWLANEVQIRWCWDRKVKLQPTPYWRSAGGLAETPCGLEASVWNFESEDLDSSDQKRMLVLQISDRLNLHVSFQFHMMEWQQVRRLPSQRPLFETVFQLLLAWSHWIF